MSDEIEQLIDKASTLACLLLASANHSPSSSNFFSHRLLLLKFWFVDQGFFHFVFLTNFCSDKLPPSCLPPSRPNMDSFYENAAEDTAPPPLPSISIKMQPEMEETTEPFSFAPAPADSNDVAVMHEGGDDDDVTASINPKDDAEWTGEDEVGSGSNESPVSKPPPKKVSHFKQCCLLSLSLFLVSSSRYSSHQCQR